MPDAPRYRLESEDGTAVVVANGRIARVDAAADLVVPLGPGTLRPGLINAHDHLHRNHYPRIGSPPYPDAYAWGRDIHERWAAEIDRGRSLDRRDALLFGALKNLLGGVTTVVHHDPWEPEFDRGFPVRVARIRSVHSLGFDDDPVASAAGPAHLPLCVHLAEGTNAGAAAEVRALDRLGLLDDRLLAVHAVGVREDGIRRLRRADAAMIWCPTSNDFLFGRTAPAAVLRSGIDVLLGSDALLTGRGTLLDELRAARGLGILDDARLAAAVGETAARRLRLPPPTLDFGAPADLLHLERPLLEAGVEDVALVVTEGVPRLGDERFASLFDYAGVPTLEVEVGAGRKLVQASLAAVGERVVGRWPEAARIFTCRHGSDGDRGFRE